MVDYDRVRLPLPVQALIGLLVQLQTVVQAKPDDVMAALLQVEAVATGRGLHQQQVNVASVPVVFFRFALVHSHPQVCSFQRPQQPVTVVLEVVADNRVLPGKLLHSLKQRLDLAVMHGDDVPVLVVHSAVTEL